MPAKVSAARPTPAAAAAQPSASPLAPPQSQTAAAAEADSTAGAEVFRLDPNIQWGETPETSLPLPRRYPCCNAFFEDESGGGGPAKPLPEDYRSAIPFALPEVEREYRRYVYGSPGIGGIAMLLVAAAYFSLVNPWVYPPNNAVTYAARTVAVITLLIAAAVLLVGTMLRKRWRSSDADFFQQAAAASRSATSESGNARDERGAEPLTTIEKEHRLALVHRVTAVTGWGVFAACQIVIEAFNPTCRAFPLPPERPDDRGCAASVADYAVAGIAYFSFFCSLPVDAFAVLFVINILATTLDHAGAGSGEMDAAADRSNHALVLGVVSAGLLLLVRARDIATRRHFDRIVASYVAERRVALRVAEVKRIVRSMIPRRLLRRLDAHFQLHAFAQEFGDEKDEEEGTDDDISSAARMSGSDDDSDAGGRVDVGRLDDPARLDRSTGSGVTGRTSSSAEKGSKSSSKRSVDLDAAVAELPREALRDTAPDATVLWIEPVDFRAFETSFVDPSTPAAGLSHLFSILDLGVAIFDVDRGVAYGDAYVVTTGLVRDDRGHVAKPWDAARMALWVCDLDEADILGMRCALVTGPAVSAVIGGARTLHYHIGGPAVDAAGSWVRAIPAREVRACDATVALVPSTAVDRTRRPIRPPTAHVGVPMHTQLHALTSVDASSNSNSRIGGNPPGHSSNNTSRDRPPGGDDSSTAQLNSSGIPSGSSGPDESRRFRAEDLVRSAASDRLRVDLAVASQAGGNGNDNEDAAPGPMIVPMVNPNPPAPRRSLWGGFKNPRTERAFRRDRERALRRGALPHSAAWIALLITVFTVLHVLDVTSLRPIPRAADGLAALLPVTLVAVLLAVVLWASVGARHPVAGPGAVVSVVACFTATLHVLPTSQVRDAPLFAIGLIVPVLLRGVLPATHIALSYSALLVVLVLPHVLLYFRSPVVDNAGAAIPQPVLGLLAIAIASARESRTHYAASDAATRRVRGAERLLGSLCGLVDGLVPRHVSDAAGMPRVLSDATALDHVALVFEALAETSAAITDARVLDVAVGRVAAVLEGDHAKGAVDTYDDVLIAHIGFVDTWGESPPPHLRHLTRAQRDTLARQRPVCLLERVWQAVDAALKQSDAPSPADGRITLRVLRAGRNSVVVGAGLIPTPKRSTLEDSGSNDAIPNGCEAQKTKKELADQNAALGRRLILFVLQLGHLLRGHAPGVRATAVLAADEATAALLGRGSIRYGVLGTGIAYATRLGEVAQSVLAAAAALGGDAAADTAADQVTAIEIFATHRLMARSFSPLGGSIVAAASGWLAPTATAATLKEPPFLPVARAWLATLDPPYTAERSPFAWRVAGAPCDRLFTMMPVTKRPGTDANDVSGDTPMHPLDPATL